MSGVDLTGGVPTPQAEASVSESVVEPPAPADELDFMIPTDDDLITDDVTLPVEGEVEQPAPAPTPAPAAPVPPPAPAPQEPQPAPAPASTPAPQGQQQPPPPQAQPEQPAAPAPDVLTQLRENREALIDALATQEFALSEDDLAALDADPGPLLQKKMAQVYLHAVTNTMEQFKQFAAQMPAMIQQTMAAMDANRSNEEKLFELFPALKGKVRNEDVMALRPRILAAEPNITQEQFLQKLGPVLLAFYGLPMTTPVPATPAPSVPAAPAAVFTPAPGGGAQPPQRVVVDDPFAQFAGLMADTDD